MLFVFVLVRSVVSHGLVIDVLSCYDTLAFEHMTREQTAVSWLLTLERAALVND
jgi:hypothetical protein